MKKWIGMFVFLIFVSIISFVIVYYNADFSIFLNTTKYKDVWIESSKHNFVIKLNQDFEGYNTSERKDKIEYIVIHYTGTTSSVEDIIESYNKQTYTSASADFFIDLEGNIYQYNIDLDNRFSWAVGGDKKADTKGGTFFGKVTNDNSLSIELSAEDEYSKWFFKSETLSSATILVQYLMDLYDVDIEHIVRHYDVTGKECPNVEGFIDEESIEWNKFKSNLS